MDPQTKRPWTLEKNKETVLDANQPPHNKGAHTTEGKTRFCEV